MYISTGKYVSQIFHVLSLVNMKGKQIHGGLQLKGWLYYGKYVSHIFQVLSFVNMKRKQMKGWFTIKRLITGKDDNHIFERHANERFVSQSKG